MRLWVSHPENHTYIHENRSFVKLLRRDRCRDMIAVSLSFLIKCILVNITA